MAHYMTVRVVDSSGKPRKRARIALYVHEFLAGGFKPDQYTDDEGQVEFKLDGHAPFTLYVDGKEIKPGKQKPEAYVKIVV